MSWAGAGPGHVQLQESTSHRFCTRRVTYRCGSDMPPRRPCPGLGLAQNTASVPLGALNTCPAPCGAWPSRVRSGLATDRTCAGPFDHSENEDVAVWRRTARMRAFLSVRRFDSEDTLFHLFTFFTSHPLSFILRLFVC